MMERQAVTIRFPMDLLKKARELRGESRSFNELVVEALRREIERRRALAAHERIRSLAAKIRKRTGVQPSSVPLIRELREGRGRRD